MQNEPSDFITLLAYLIAMITGKEVAAVLGPYAAIMIAAVAGAGVALSGPDSKMNNWQAARYVSFRVLMALCFTVSASQILKKYIPGIEPTFSLMPVAFLIAWVKDYNELARAAYSKVVGVFKGKPGNE